MDVLKDVKKKGVIMWDANGCQTCYAVLDLDSKFTMSTDKPVKATLTLKKVDSHHILKITED